MTQQDGHRLAWGDIPVYDRLVAEMGDVPAEVSRAAAHLLRETERAIDFSSLRNWTY
ncbi:hypothetical protein [Streptomyces collinus]|uniref:hypothetical protein n=1 Tax=Streptomyces collinus TaxID=42684 RepID=UPI002942E38B|nr:hypothetical protein [Streptomyces collinus]